MKKMLMLTLLLCSHFAHSMSEDDFMLFDYIADQQNMRTLYESDKDAFKNLTAEKSEKKNLAEAFRIWAYNLVQKYCKSKKQTGCSEAITKIGTVAVNKFLGDFKTAYELPMDLVLMVNDTVFDELGSLENINIYLNALEQRYVKKQDQVNVFEQLIKHLKPDTLVINNLLMNEENFITFLLGYFAHKIPLDSTAMGSIYELLYDKKLDLMAEYIFKKKIDAIEKINEDETKESAIKSLNQEAAKLNPSSQIYKGFIEYLNKNSLDNWAQEIEKQREEEKNTIKVKLEEVHEEITIKPKKGKRKEKGKKSSGKKFDVGEDTIIKPEKRESKKELNFTTPKEEKPNTEEPKTKEIKFPEPNTKEKEELPKETSEEISLSPELTQEEKQTLNKEREALVDFDFVDMKSREADAIIDLGEATGCITQEQANMQRLLYNLYQEKKGSSEVIPFSQQKDFINHLKNDHCIDVPALVNSAVQTLDKNAEDQNLYLNALMKGFMDNQLNKIPLDDPKKTIADVAQKNNLTNLAQYYQPSKTQSTSPSPTTKITTTPVDAHNAIKQLAEAFLDISH